MTQMADRTPAASAGSADERAPASPTFGLFIGGEWVDSTSGRTFESRNPADTRDIVGRFQAGTAADTAKAIRSAEEAQRRGRPLQSAARSCTASARSWLPTRNGWPAR